MFRADETAIDAVKMDLPIFNSLSSSSIRPNRSSSSPLLWHSFEHLAYATYINQALRLRKSKYWLFTNHFTDPTMEGGERVSAHSALNNT